MHSIEWPCMERANFNWNIMYRTAGKKLTCSGPLFNEQRCVYIGIVTLRVDVAITCVCVCMFVRERERERER